VLKSARKKWKDFKVVLKRKYFNPKLTRKQNICNGCGKRLPGPQWEWLVRHWKTSASQAKCEKNKAIRAIQLNGTPTSGSRSFAVTLDQLVLAEIHMLSYNPSFYLHVQSLLFDNIVGDGRR